VDHSIHYPCANELFEFYEQLMALACLGYLCRT
jgi:hypothetical protein